MGFFFYFLVPRESLENRIAEAKELWVWLL